MTVFDEAWKLIVFGAGNACKYVTLTPDKCAALLAEVDRLHKLTAALKCDRCGKPLEILGGLMFGPPSEDLGKGVMVVVKRHICVDCWAAL